jgi:hypothetical protein
MVTSRFRERNFKLSSSVYRALRPSISPFPLRHRVNGTTNLSPLSKLPSTNNRTKFESHIILKNQWSHNIKNKSQLSLKNIIKSRMPAHYSLQQDKVQQEREDRK